MTWENEVVITRTTPVHRLPDPYIQGGIEGEFSIYRNTLILWENNHCREVLNWIDELSIEDREALIAVLVGSTLIDFVWSDDVNRSKIRYDVLGGKWIVEGSWNSQTGERCPW